MTQQTQHPTTPAGLTAAIVAATDAARAQDTATFEATVLRLAGADVEQVHVVVGWALREVLERAHPDGLDADDLRDAVAATARAGIWWPRLDPQLLVVVLTGALGAHDLADTLQAAPPALTLGHAMLLLTALLPVAADLPPLLAASLADVRRAELNEMP